MKNIPKVFTGPIDKLSETDTLGHELIKQKAQELMEIVQIYTNRNFLDYFNISVTAGLMKGTTCGVKFEKDDEVDPYHIADRVKNE